MIRSSMRSAGSKNHGAARSADRRRKRSLMSAKVGSILAGITCMNMASKNKMEVEKIRTQADFLHRLSVLYTNNIDISSRKNSDYANQGDPFQNFRVCEAMGIPAEVGLIVRMSDKLMRATNLIQPGREAKVKDEAVLDTLSDLANYAMILRMYLEQKQIS